jgi:anthranilate phosphoribosyltransferase
MKDAAAFFEALLNDNATPAQIAAALSALAIKGETAEELAGMAQVMRARALKINTRQRNLVDTCGTGSSAAKTFNVSTAAALVAAGAGATVAKHTNRTVASQTGSADVLEKLGVRLTGGSTVVQTCISGAGIGFLFAPNFHPALRRIGDVRRALGVRTSLNILGALSNPTLASRQVIGVWHADLVEPVAQALALLGTEHAWVVHGNDGLDEVTLAGETLVAEVQKNKVRKFTVKPQDFGLKPGKIVHLRVNTPEESAQIINEVLESKRRDEARSLVVLNAAAAIIVAGLAKQPIQAARLAEQSLDSDSARTKLTRLIQTTNK